MTAPVTTVPPTVQAHYAAAQATSQAAVQAAAAMWAGAVAARDFVSGYADVFPDLVQLVTAAQLLNASRADAYVSGVLPDSSEFFPRVDPAMLAGVASDGRELAGLLRAPVVRTLLRLAAGQTYRDATLGGQIDLATIVTTQVADAGRVADGVATATHGAQGYVRMLQPPSCSRCVILAGKWFRWNEGFQRHPRCDCIHIPAVENTHDYRTDPKAYFESLSEAEQDKAFTKSGAEAIRLGADIGQIVNSRRGISTAQVGGKAVKITLEGTTKRGWYSHVRRALGNQTKFTREVDGVRRNARPRIMPETIFEIAADRPEAIALLRSNGFFVDGDSADADALATIAAGVLARAVL